MSERITAKEARERTREALDDPCYIAYYVAAIDPAIKEAADNGETEIYPLSLMIGAHVKRYVSACENHAVRKHYEERGFQWTESMANGQSAIGARQRGIKLSWAEDEDEEDCNENSD